MLAVTRSFPPQDLVASYSVCSTSMLAKYLLGAQKFWELPRGQ